MSFLSILLCCKNGTKRWDISLIIDTKGCYQISTGFKQSALKFFVSGFIGPSKGIHDKRITNSLKIYFRFVV